MKRPFVMVLAVMGVLFATSVVFAQTAAPADTTGATDAQTEAALKDLSAVYGSPVVRVDQAKAICNQEQYFLDCAEIGKKHDLFDDKRAKQVDTILSELKGRVVNDIKQCGSVDCLIQVATSIAKKLNAASPSVAKFVDLTPQKVNEKRTIVEAAKTAGVDIEECRTIDPDNASVELLRGCARLAKSESIQKYIPKDAKEQAEKSDTTIALKESLSKGEIQCGDGTLNGCGNFCLNPSRDASKQGVSAIPAVCNQIAEKFFGKNGVEELKRAYTSVQERYNALAGQSEKFIFTTADGQKLTDQASIGRYMEEAGKRGDVAAVEKGMNFLVQNNIVSEKDRDFALTMVKKIQDRGAVDFDFDKCRVNPEQCADLVPEENRDQFTAMGQIEKAMRAEMGKRGITDPSRCEFDSSIREACMAAAKSALPQIENIASKSKETSNIIADIKQKIRFGEEGIEARRKVEKSFQSGEVAFGEQKFRSMTEVEDFCRREPDRCLAETARTGVFNRDVAAEKYQQAAENHYNDTAPNQQQRPDVPGAPPSNFYPSASQPYPSFDRADALRQFEKWLDNPQGPPPMPARENIVPYAPYPQYNQYDPYPRSYQDQRYDYYSSTTTQRYNVCQYATSIPYPCRAGEYRQESVNESGCSVYSACIPIATKTQPPTIDPKIQQICPSLPTVDSCPAGEEKTVSFSSPECGTYYACSPVKDPETGIKFPHTLTNGKIVVSIEEARNYCRQYGPGSGQGIASECSTKFGVVYDINPPTPTPTPTPGDGRSFRNGLYFTPSFMSCMERFGSRDSAVRIQNWLAGGTVPPPWNELPSKGQSDVAACERENVTPTDVPVPPGTAGTDCSRFGSGWHSMDSSGNCFSPSMTEYQTPAGALQSCTTSSVYGCTGSPSTNTYQPPTGQKEQVWNNLGLRSWIRTDADTARIETLKQACANVRSQDNVWKPEAGTQSSVDFGMPDFVKCGTANACTSTQYFDGSSCTTRTSQNTAPGSSCTAGQYWNGSACVASTTPTTPTTQTWTQPVSGSCSSELIGLLDSGCHNMGNAWFNGPMTRYVLPGTSVARDCSISSIPSCPGSYAQPTTGGCVSGQYWNGSSCVNTSTTDTAPSCGSGQYWNGSSCVTSPPPCSAGQYWNGSSCVTSSTSYSSDPQTACAQAGGTWESASSYCRMPGSTSYSSDPQTACAQAGGTWESASNYCRMPGYTPPSSTSCGSGLYWDGSSCVASSPPISYFCPKNHDWNGSSCSLAQRSGIEKYTANAISAFLSLFGL